MKTLALTIVFTLAGCSNSSAPPPGPTFNMVGTWLGEWASDAVPQGGQLPINVWHGGQGTDNRIMGSGTLLGHLPFFHGDIVGNMIGQEIVFTLHADDLTGAAIFSGTVVTPSKMNGTFLVTAGALTGDSGVWSATKVRGGE